MAANLGTSASDQSLTGSSTHCRPGDDPSAHWSLYWNEHNIPGLKRRAQAREMDRVAEERYRAMPTDETDYDQWEAMDECPSPTHRMMPGYCKRYDIMRAGRIRRKREIAASMPHRRYPSPPTSPLPHQPPQQPPQQPSGPQVNHLPTSHNENHLSADLPQTDPSLPPILHQTNAPPADPLQRDTLSLKHTSSAEHEAASEDDEKHEKETDEAVKAENKGHDDFEEEQDLPLPPINPQSNADRPADFPQSVIHLPHVPQLELIEAIPTASDPSSVPKPTNHKRKASELGEDGVDEPTGSHPQKRRYSTGTTGEKVKGRRIRSVSSSRINDHSQSRTG